jgi:hypothetical protein
MMTLNAFPFGSSYLQTNISGFFVGTIIFSMKTLSMTALIIISFSMTALSMTSFSVMTLSTMSFSITIHSVS